MSSKAFAQFFSTPKAIAYGRYFSNISGVRTTRSKRSVSTRLRNSSNPRSRSNTRVPRMVRAGMKSPKAATIRPVATPAATATSGPCPKIPSNSSAPGAATNAALTSPRDQKGDPDVIGVVKIMTIPYEDSAQLLFDSREILVEGVLKILRMDPVSPAEQRLEKPALVCLQLIPTRTRSYELEDEGLTREKGEQRSRLSLLDREESTNSQVDDRGGYIPEIRRRVEERAGLCWRQAFGWLVLRHQRA